MMRILVSNDDGVHAAGLAHLAEHLGQFGEVVVVAPDRDRSAASNSLTVSTPLRVMQLQNGFYSVQGTPTDCVHLAITGFIPGHFDMVVAGINAGANLGDDVLYSGTVAAAMEGRFLGLPAIAVSLTQSRSIQYRTACVIVERLIKKCQSHPLEKNMLLNVNVPDLPLADLAGIEVTRLGQRHKAEPVIAGQDPRGHEIFWIGPAGSEQDAGPGTDFYAINHGKASVTPIKLDLTDYESLNSLTNWIDNSKLMDS